LVVVSKRKRRLGKSRGKNHGREGVPDSDSEGRLGLASLVSGARE